jgi:hypothetical protein
VAESYRAIGDEPEVIRVPVRCVFQHSTSDLLIDGVSESIENAEKTAHEVGTIRGVIL